MPAGSLVLWSGNSGAFAAALIHQVPLVLRGVEVFNIDCAMRFNAFLLVDEALRSGVAPEEVLQRVRVQRAFTPYQILDVLHGVYRNPGRSVYFLLAPCKQFFDGDVAQDEAVFLLNRMLLVIRDLRKAGVPLLIVERPEYRNAAFAPVFARLRAMADHIREIGEGGGSIRIARHVQTIAPQLRGSSQSIHNRTAKKMRSQLGR